MRAAVLALAMVIAILVGPGHPAAAQDSTTTTLVELPDAEIIPRPNSGRAPEDAGDRGGALQAVVFLTLVAALGGGVAYLVAQSRRARS